MPAPLLDPVAETPTFGCTTMADDARQLQSLAEAPATSTEKQRLQLAVVYRLAHKRILARHLRRVLFALALLGLPTAATLPQSRRTWTAALDRAMDSLDNKWYK